MGEKFYRLFCAMDMGLEKGTGLPAAALPSACAPLTVLPVRDVSSLHMVVKKVHESCLPSIHTHGCPMEQPQTPLVSNPDSNSGHFTRSRRILLLSSITDSQIHQGWKRSLRPLSPLTQCWHAHHQTLSPSATSTCL